MMNTNNNDKFMTVGQYLKMEDIKAIIINNQTKRLMQYKMSHPVLSEMFDYMSVIDLKEICRKEVEKEYNEILINVSDDSDREIMIVRIYEPTMKEGGFAPSYLTTFMLFEDEKEFEEHPLNLYENIGDMKHVVNHYLSSPSLLPEIMDGLFDKIWRKKYPISIEIDNLEIFQNSESDWECQTIKKEGRHTGIMLYDILHEIVEKQIDDFWKAARYQIRYWNNLFNKRNR